MWKSWMSSMPSMGVHEVIVMLMLLTGVVVELLVVLEVGLQAEVDVLTVDVRVLVGSPNFTK